MDSRTFTVASGSLSGFAEGEEVSEGQLGDANIDALVAAGHLVERAPRNGSKSTPASTPAQPATPDNGNKEGAE